MNKKVLLVVLGICVLPLIADAQVLGGTISGFHGVLEKLFDEMLPLCRRMIDVGRALAGFAALLYISVRVWGHLARAEPIDFYPLLRPFAIGVAIVLFPSLIGLMNGVLKPTVQATGAMSKDSQKAILYHIQQQHKAVLKSPPPGFGMSPDAGKDEQYEQTDEGSGGGFFQTMKSAFSFSFMKNAIKLLISEFVGILYSTAAICVNTVRTFTLIVLAILGPLVLGLSVFDGFSHTLANWFARYINIYMWLPVANIFGAISSKILENMMVLDQDFFSSTAYIVFMLISIVGYATIPSVANYIVQAASDPILNKVNSNSQAAGAAVLKAMV